MFELDKDSWDELLKMADSVIQTQDTDCGSGVVDAAESFVIMINDAKEEGKESILIEDEEVEFLNTVFGSY